jgi:TolB protein
MRKLFFLPALLAYLPAFTQNQQNVESVLHTIDITTKEQKTIYKKNIHFEAPNWSTDGKYFIVNSLGKLYKIPADGSDMQLINTEFANE